MKKTTLFILMLILALTLSLCSCSEGDILDNAGTPDDSNAATDQELTLTSKSLTIENGKISGTVSATTETFSFSEDITLPSGAECTVTYSPEADADPLDKTVALNEGENTFYLTVSYKNEEKLFEVSIYRKHIYTVQFVTAGGNSIAPIEAEEGSIVTPPQITRAGYDFVNWDYDFSLPITEDILAIADWAPRSDIPYKIEYYFKDAGSDEYELRETVDAIGTAGTTVSTPSSAPEHYTLNTANTSTSDIILGDGSAVIKLFYDEILYSIRADHGQGVSVSGTGSYPYGSIVLLQVTVLNTDELIYDGLYINDQKLTGETAIMFKVERDVHFSVKTTNANAFDILWDDTTLIFEMTESSDQHHIPSTSRRYLAGDSSDNLVDYSALDTMISKRNELAYETTGVTVEYKYLPDLSQYAWGQNIDRIQTQVMSNVPDSPDIYYNFVYDMVSASLKGAFANLYSTSRGEGALEGANYFKFIKPNFNPDTSGYMYEYMSSLTLSRNKMYCLASDYFIDISRSFLIVPVNIELLETVNVDLSNSDAFNADRDGDNDFTYSDFHELILAGLWNYEMLAEFSKAVYQSNDAAGSSNEPIKGTLGFALSASSGISASGMLYSTPIQFIQRIFDENIKGYNYIYKENNIDFYTFCDNLTALFKTQGVAAFTDSDTRDYGITALQAIRNSFSKGNVLFGGIIPLGALEYEEYQSMENCFGIAPIPLYRNFDPLTLTPDPYLTQISNLACVGAISANTTKFAQCTAFLDYQSSNSTDTFNEYYNFKLQYDIADGLNESVEMIQYLRANIRSAFDATMDDVVSVFSSPVASEGARLRWHTIITDSRFTVNYGTMEIKYTQLVGNKQRILYDLINKYDSLPD